MTFSPTRSRAPRRATPISSYQDRDPTTRLAPGKDRFTMWDFTGVTLRHGDDETPGEGGVVVVREGKPPIYQARRLLMLDVHDEIDPTTREWVTVDENGR